MPALRIRVGLVVKPLMYGFAYISSMPGLVGAVGEDLDLQIVDCLHARLSLLERSSQRLQRASDTLWSGSVGRRLVVAVVDEDRRGSPRALPASMSRQRSPTMKLRARSMSNRRRRAAAGPGCGFRQSQPSASS